MNDAVTDLKGSRIGGTREVRRLGGRVDSMASAFATARVELAQTVRSPGFWALQLVLLVTGLLVLVDEGGATYLRFAPGHLRQFAAFHWLLLLLLAWPAFRRVAGGRGDLIFSAPLASGTQALGTLLGIFAWLVPATFAQFAARWGLGEAVAGQANWTLLTTGPLLALSSAIVALGSIACLSLILPRLLPALLVWLGLWVFLLQRAGGTFGGFTGPFLPLFDPLNVFFEGLVLSPSVGLGLMRPLVAALALQFLAVGIVLLVAWLCLLPLVDRRRSDPSRVLRYVGPVVAVSLAAWAIIGHRTEVRAQQPPQSPLVTQLDEWRVETSVAEVEFEPASRGRPIRGTHLLEVAPAGVAWPEQLVLRVNPGIAVTASADGVPLLVEREGDSVVVDIAGVAPAAGAGLELLVGFDGAPFWPYADHRFRQGGAFPAIDSSQPITSLSTNGVGFLLRGGDWLPWPWSSHPHAAEAAQRLTVATIAGGASSTVAFEGSLPKLVAVVPPPERDVAGVSARVGRDAGAGLARALANIGRNLARAWPALGERGEPRLVAMPYLPDAYADEHIVVIPETYDLPSSHAIGGAYRSAGDRRLEERAALQLLARAWLNGQVRETSGYAQARSFTTDLRQDAAARSHPETRGNRWVQVFEVGPVLLSRSPIWFGADPLPYDVTPFALWLGTELAADEVREADVALLHAIDGSDRDYFDLSDRLMPWALIRNQDQMRTVSGLAGWADRVGRREAVELFARTYGGLEDQRHDAVLDALARATGVPILERDARGADGTRSGVEGGSPE